MAACGLVTVGYLVYRGMYTLNHEGWYSGVASWLLYVAELWGGMSLLLFFILERLSKLVWWRAL